jgi:hypothetical protein
MRFDKTDGRFRDAYFFHHQDDDGDRHPMIEAVSISKTFLNLCETTRRNILKDIRLRLGRFRVIKPKLIGVKQIGIKYTCNAIICKDIVVIHR